LAATAALLIGALALTGGSTFRIGGIPTSLLLTAASFHRFMFRRRRLTVSLGLASRNLGGSSRSGGMGRSGDVDRRNPEARTHAAPAHATSSFRGPRPQLLARVWDGPAVCTRSSSCASGPGKL
jgi:hypothetical protein